MKQGGLLFRAQLGHDWEPQPVYPHTSDNETLDLVPGAYKPERMKPLKDAAREGRINPKGIPCLYLADDPDTAMAETRPWLRSFVSLGQFKIVRPLRIMNLPKPQLYFPNISLAAVDETGDDTAEIPGVEELDAKGLAQAVWGEIAFGFAEPVDRSDDKADYAPTQILAEVFRKAGCDGIRYKSQLGPGFSFALFNMDDAVLMNCGLYETTNLSFKFEQIANPYYVAAHYPELAEHNETGND